MTAETKAAQEHALATHEWSADYSGTAPPRCVHCRCSMIGPKSIRACGGLPISTLDRLERYRRALEDIAGGLYGGNPGGLATRENLIALAKGVLPRVIE